MNELKFHNPEAVASPGLIVDVERVVANIDRMLACVDGKVERLRPHVKTHKMPDVVRLQRAVGIERFKAATLAEAEMVAAVGPADVLVAYQLVGPNIDRFSQLIQRYPASSFAAVVDNIDAFELIAQRTADRSRPLRLFIDVDCGMHRTGIELGADLDRLRELIEAFEGVEFCGLHVYDGHIHDASLQSRRDAATEIIARIGDYERRCPCPEIIGGGSPTFGIWSSQTSWQCSPGTPVFWDVGYGTAYPDLPFQVAAALLTRVISKPGARRVCLDLGYKSVASEMPLQQRVVIPAFRKPQYVGQSEEHLVVETPSATEFRIGDPVLAYPRHICPTVALHAAATVVRGGRLGAEVWPITARDRDRSLASAPPS